LSGLKPLDSGILKEANSDHNNKSKVPLKRGNLQHIIHRVLTMKNGKAIIDHVKKSGYVFNNADHTYYPPEQAAALNIKPVIRKTRITHVKTGWIDDTRNLANKAKQTDMFIKLVEQELDLEVWPEFYFSTEKRYRLDYAIPITPNSGELKIGIEVNGGIWKKGASGHSSGTGIRRDMDKSNLLTSLGWRLISVEPDELLSLSILEAIKKLKNK
jgi:hypothetical protein